MNTLVLTASLFVCLPGGPTYKGQPREPHPFAPSLPKLTENEDKELADIVQRFIDQDTGKLKGDAGKKAVADFKALGAAATFALLEGLNKAANMEDSCPAVLIAKKLNLIINASKDMALLDFLRENIGADVTAKRHLNVLQDLRVSCMLRKSALQRADIAAGKKNGPTVGGNKNAEKPPKKMTTSELVTAVGKEKGDKLNEVLVELATRTDEQVLPTLAAVAGKDDKATQPLAQSLLVDVLARQSADELKGWLTKGTKEVRTAAARAVADKGYKWVEELITALADSEEEVRQASRAALRKLAGASTDHGPEVGASASLRALAQQQWRAYWEKK